MPDRLATLPNEYEIALTPPDLSPYKAGTDGIPYVHTFRAEEPGPHVAITAVVHGNEPCGAIALDTLLREGVRPARGTLSFAFLNIAAYEAFDPENPNASRWVDEDFNRLWSSETLDGNRESTELRRARELRPFIETVDILLDIHSMQHATAPLMMAGPSPKGVSLAKAVGTPEVVVIDAGHQAGPRLRDYAPFIDPATQKNALLVECGQHWEAGADRVALDVSVRFLRATGSMDEAFYGDAFRDEQRQEVWRITDRVTIATEDFAFVEPYRGMEVIPAAGTVIAHDGGVPVMTPHNDCILIMPSKRLWPGQTAVRLGKRVG